MMPRTCTQTTLLSPSAHLHDLLPGRTRALVQHLEQHRQQLREVHVRRHHSARVLHNLHGSAQLQVWRAAGEELGNASRGGIASGWGKSM